MNTVVRSAQAAVEISSLGAEVVSFKGLEDGCEYIWHGDPAYWTGHAPLLFPIVGSVNQGEMRVEGRTYRLNNHGFARRSEFQLIDKSEDRAVFRLSSSEETLAVYPFKFSLTVTYSLKGNKLDIQYQVDNLDDREIWFQIGTHPALNCPIGGEGSLEDYYLEFEREERMERLFLNASGLLASGKSAVQPQQGNLLPLSHEMFEEGALVFHNLHSRRIALRNKHNDKQVVVTYENLPDLGIWQPRNAPFVCVEPWHGTTDEDSFTGEFKEKHNIITLPKGEGFTCSLSLEIH